MPAICGCVKCGAGLEGEEGEGRTEAAQTGNVKCCVIACGKKRR